MLHEPYPLLHCIGNKQIKHMHAPSHTLTHPDMGGGIHNEPVVTLSLNGRVIMHPSLHSHETNGRFENVLVTALYRYYVTTDRSVEVIPSISYCIPHSIVVCTGISLVLHVSRGQMIIFPPQLQDSGAVLSHCHP